MIASIPSIIRDDATHIAVITVGFEDGGNSETFIVLAGTEAECDDLLTRAADDLAVPYRGTRVPASAQYETRPAVAS